MKMEQSMGESGEISKKVNICDMKRRKVPKYVIRRKCCAKTILEKRRKRMVRQKKLKATNYDSDSSYKESLFEERCPIKKIQLGPKVIFVASSDDSSEDEKNLELVKSPEDIRRKIAIKYASNDDLTSNEAISTSSLSDREFYTTKDDLGAQEIKTTACSLIKRAKKAFIKCIKFVLCGTKLPNADQISLRVNPMSSQSINVKKDHRGKLNKVVLCGTNLPNADQISLRVNPMSSQSINVKKDHQAK